MKHKKAKRRRIDVNVEELDQIVDRARQAPLSDADYDKLKTALHALIEKLLGLKRSEKLASVFGDDQTPASPAAPAQAKRSAGHGRNGAQAFSGARKVSITHQQLASGDRCPDCGRGKVYVQREPKALVRIVGQAPLAATVYELQRLRCNACGQVITAQEPEGGGTGEVRRNGGRHDRAAQVWQRRAVPSAGANARTDGHSAAGGHPVGSGRGGGRADQTGAR